MLAAVFAAMAWDSRCQRVRETDFPASRTDPRLTAGSSRLLTQPPQKGCAGTQSGLTGFATSERVALTFTSLAYHLHGFCDSRDNLLQDLEESVPTAAGS